MSEDDLTYLEGIDPTLEALEEYEQELPSDTLERLRRLTSQAIGEEL